MALSPTIKLSSGRAMPRVGLGTSKLVEAQILSNIVDAGARHLDGARLYGNEAAVGRAVEASKIPRAEFFLTSKLFMAELGPDAVAAAVDDTLADLRTTYLDLLLIHWPLKFKKGTVFARDGAPGDFREAWAAMEALVDAGKVRSLGVSNFDEAQLAPLLEASRIKPSVNQIEAHPLFPNEALTKWCLARGVAVVAWGPLARSARRLGSDDLELWNTAKMHSVSVARAALRWNLERGVCVIPQSTRADHVRDALAAVEGPKLNAQDAKLLGGSRLPGRRRFPDVVGVWPATATRLARVFGWALHVFFTLIFAVAPPLDVVALAKRRALRREAAYATFAKERANAEAEARKKMQERLAAGKVTVTDGVDDLQVDPSVEGAARRLAETEKAS